MKTFAIETSCDDTSLAIVSFEENFFNVEKILLHSQIKNHTKFWWVVPELASRLHEEKIIDLLEEIWLSNIEKTDFISYTCCPWLPGSLLVGKTLANTLEKFLNKELVPVNHIYGHIFSIFCERKFTDIEFPLLVLTVSGGHNEIFLVSKGDFETEELNQYLLKIKESYALSDEIIKWELGPFKLYKLGFTLDDAAWEAFDKVSKMLGWPYPGWKWIFDLAKNYNFKDYGIKFPRIWLKKNEFLFSFSGLKAQVNYKIKEFEEKWILSEEIKSAIAYEFQQAVVETLWKKLLKAAKYFWIKNIALVWGVSANESLKSFIKDNMEQYWILNFYTPVKNLYSTDNAAMIGVVGLISKINC